MGFALVEDANIITLKKTKIQIESRGKALALKEIHYICKALRRAFEQKNR